MHLHNRNSELTVRIKYGKERFGLLYVSAYIGRAWKIRFEKKLSLSQEGLVSGEQLHICGHRLLWYWVLNEEEGQR